MFGSGDARGERDREIYRRTCGEKPFVVVYIAKSEFLSMFKFLNHLGPEIAMIDVTLWRNG